jgi:hypothetical protein
VLFLLLRTHTLFNAGVLSALFYLFFPHSLFVFLAFALSWLSNTLIDRLGHEWKGEYLSRTPRTHTPTRSAFWGALSSLVIVFPLFFFGVRSVPLLLFLGLLGALSGLLHVALDSFTERGIYVKRGSVWRRWRLAGYRYDNPIANALFSGAGITLILLVLTQV